MGHPLALLARPKARIIALTALLLVAGAIQLGSVFRDYGLPWAKAAWRTRTMPAMARSARFLFGSTGSEFVAFLLQRVPEDVAIAVPDAAGAMSTQNNLQFFFLPRAVIACPCSGAKDNGWTPECAACLQSGRLAVPAIKGFPPTQLMRDRHIFLPFPGPTDVYRGVYLPTGLASGTTETAIREPEALLTDWSAVFRAVGILLLVMLLGTLVARLLWHDADILVILPLSLPIGLGILTWATFALAWINAGRVGLATFAGVYSGLCLVAGGILVARGPHGIRGLRMPGRGMSGPIGGVKGSLTCLLLTTILVTVLASCVVSVARAYSIYDAIANWALKGYAIAHFESIYAGESWGGHGLAYPQNLHLGTALFRLVDGDLLPGSKLLFSGYYASLVLGCMVFWKRAGLPSTMTAAGGLVVASVPIVFFHSTSGYANLPYATYVVLAALSLTSGLHAGRVGEVAAGSILLGLAAWTRPEGGAFAALGILCICLASIRLLNKRVLAAILLPFSILIGLWLAFGAGFQASDEVGAALRAFLGGFPEASISSEAAMALFGYASRAFTAFGTWGFLVLLVAGLGVVSLAAGTAGRHLLFRGVATAALAWLLGAGAMLYAAWPGRSDYLEFLADGFNRAMLPGALLMLWAAIGASGLVAMGSVDGSGPRHAR